MDQNICNAKLKFLDIAIDALIGPFGKILEAILIQVSDITRGNQSNCKACVSNFPSPACATSTTSTPPSIIFIRPTILLIFKEIEKSR